MQEVPEDDSISVVDGLQIQTFGDISDIEAPTLLIFLHGDGCVADYMKSLARTVIRKNVISVIMARPGCSVSNRRSSGSHGDVCNHYTENRIGAVSISIYSLKQHYNAGRVFLIGHSGDAATAGIIIGRNPDLVDGIVAVAYPANVPAWKAFPEKCKGWTNNLSSHDFVTRIKQSTLIFIANGANDQNTPPSLSTIYVDKATEYGLVVEHIIVASQ